MPKAIQIRITLTDVAPPVWRRVQVPETVTLAALHDIIQAAMGWQDSHLHAFEVNNRRYAGGIQLEGGMGPFGERVYNEANLRLRTVVERGVESFSYIYDFGDDWHHEIRIERANDGPDTGHLPRLLDGEGACPPEDVGGPPGYEMLLEALADPGHPEHATMRAWFDDADIDPSVMDREAIEDRLAARRAPVWQRVDTDSPGGSRAAASMPEAPAETDAEPDLNAIIDNAAAVLGDPGSSHTLPPSLTRFLMASRETAAVLVARLFGAGETDIGQVLLLRLLLDEARMDQENRGSRGPAFLADLFTAIETAQADGMATAHGVSKIASALSDVGLAVPESLSETLHTLAGAELPDDPEAMQAALDDQIDVLLNESGEPGEVHAALGQVMAGFSADARAALVEIIARRPNPVLPRVLVSWLLDPAAQVRLAAATSLAERFRANPPDRALTALLVAARRWMPADAAREAADRAIAGGGPAVVNGHTQDANPGTVEAVLASVPDGSGAQQFAALIRRDERMTAAMVLVKTGHGVKDAFALTESPDQMEAAVRQIREVSNLVVDLEAMLTAIGAALDEGAGLGLMPPAGLLDVLEALPVDVLESLPASPEAWGQRADPDGKLAAATKQLRGRLVNESRDWEDRIETVDSWFECDGDLEQAVLDAPSEAAARRAVLATLESRRAYWAVQCFRAAHVLRAAMRLRLADSFAAVGQAFLEGRPLNRIPIVEQMVDISLAACLDPDGEALDHSGDGDHGEDPVVEFVAAINTAPPPDRAALDRLVALLSDPSSPPGTMTLPALDGFLHAIAIPADGEQIEDWMMAIWGDQMPPFSSRAQAQDTLGTIVGRYRQILANLEQPDSHHTVILSPDAQTPNDPSDWAGGFMTGIGLHPDPWEGIAHRSGPALASILSAVDEPGLSADTGLAPAELARMRATLPERLPQIVRALWTASRHPAPTRRRTGPKVGRNDPCPCGSGRKYKKCCGA